MVDKIVEVGILFDFYGKLLSKSQYLAIEFYYIYDLSLGEIGEELGISRQGVYDTLKRAENRLYSYEEKLGLVKKFSFTKEKVKDILKYSHDIEKEAEELGLNKTTENVKKIKGIALEILESDQEVI
ncbi:DNA-binding protein [Anaerosalibacter bizertensis]|uniref:UPF0122 protein FYJ27_09145 n=1 Tax=Anaerosalibacter bizertensis TaxID=932217 RepID=A0A844FIU4_9FIRM|nr:DNA-binding protein [Anaerosalibacter bizertensis]MBV1816577.1 DNA-binding protein [Bacteroidales bacterium MSK.15.36]HHV27209.1 DNA-binding protein [Tissierellia bacterium]MBU5293323.1 DNA-binding protein [Anaerosalibacter bizertensis]MCB5558619.1 DNA-binding protein [Anaerosalibacter bizertensis]MCG4563964.1 DNA-binding protein [Anaerosalibacter bizertensis]